LEILSVCFFYGFSLFFSYMKRVHLRRAGRC
jgi:hypothetical protein